MAQSSVRFSDLCCLPVDELVGAVNAKRRIASAVSITEFKMESLIALCCFAAVTMAAGSYFI